MRKKSCGLEKEVMDCLKSGKISSEIEKHISECPLCEDAVTVFEWMSQYKSRSWKAEMVEKTLPDPETIWNRASTKRKPDKGLVKKALRPLFYPRAFSYAALFVGVVYLFLSNMKGIGNIIASRLGVGPALDLLSRITAQFFLIFLIPAVIVSISILFCVFVVAFDKLKKTA